MSPRAAMDSQVFLIYLAILISILILAGGAIALLRWGLKKEVGHAWASYRSWLVMVPLVLVCLFLGRIATIVGLTLVCGA